MKKTTLVLIVMMFTGGVMAQKFKSSIGEASFFSEATLEDIAAKNTHASSVFDSQNGDIVFSIPIDQFQFDKSLMQEHFNEKYMESEKYPKAIFKGKVIGYQSDNENNDVTAEGEITIHGVKRQIEVKGEMKNKSDKIYLTSKFIVRLEDHKVKIPKLMWQNIAEQVEVKINFVYGPL